MYKGNQLDQVKFNKDNVAQLEFLIKHLRDCYTKEIVVWQYENGVYSTGLFFVQEMDVIIASQGMIPIFLILNGEPLLTAKSETSFLLPEFRGKGVFESLYAHTLIASEQDDIQIVWGFTALSNVWRNKLKFDVYEGIIQESELQIQFFKSLFLTWSTDKSLINKIKQSLKSVVALSKVKTLPKANQEYYAEFIETKDEANIKLVCDLYENWVLNYPGFTSIYLNQDYLKWRILHNPVVQYKIVGIFKNHQLVGAGIVNDNVDKTYLLDFIVPDNEHLNYCFIKMIRFLKHSSAFSHITYWASNKNEYTNKIHSLFKNCGAYLYVNDNMNFVIKKTNQCKLSNLNISSFCINGLWTEGFRI